MPPDRVMILLSRLSHSDRSRSTFSIWAGLRFLPNSPREKETVAQTLSKASVVSSCGTRPIIERAARKSRSMSWPPTEIEPSVRPAMPQMIEISVVLPAPLGPSSAKISPLSMDRSMFFSAWKPPA